MTKLYTCIVLSAIIALTTAVNVDIGTLCSDQILAAENCRKAVQLSCPQGEEEKSEIKFTDSSIYNGQFPGNKFVVELTLGCSSPQPQTFHEISIQNITFPNSYSTVRIGDGDKLNENAFYDFAANNENLQFTAKDVFWIVIDITITQDFQITNVIIHTASIPHRIIPSEANTDGIVATDLFRNTEYIWTLPSLNSSGTYYYLTALFHYINLTTTQGDLLLVSDGEPLTEETIIMPYTAQNLTLQIRKEYAKITLQTGRHVLPLQIGFEASFGFAPPITTPGWTTPTPPTKPPNELPYLEIVVLGWPLADQLNTNVIDDVKSELNAIVNCHISTDDTYQIFLLNQTTCSHSWTVSYTNCTRVMTGTPNLTLTVYKQALGDLSCRGRHDKYKIRFPEEMFDFYNMVAVPIAAVSLAIIVVSILAIWRGSVAFYYNKQLKAKKYSATPSGDNKDDPWTKGKDGQINDAFEPVEDDDDVIFDPTIDGSVYSRYSSISTGTGPSSFISDDEPASATYTAGKFPRGRRLGSADAPGPYTTVPTTEMVQQLRLPRTSTASSAAVSSTEF